MVRTKLLVVLSLAIAASTAAAQEKPKMLTSVSPRFVTVFEINQRQGVLDLVSVTVRFAAKTVKMDVKKDGKLQTVTKTVYEPVYEKHIGRLALKSAEVFDAGGKKLSSEDVWKRVAVGATVLVSADGNKVDSVYLSALAKDTLVFVSPQYVLPTAPTAVAPPGPLPKSTKP